MIFLPDWNFNLSWLILLCMLFASQPTGAPADFTLPVITDYSQWHRTIICYLSACFPTSYPPHPNPSSHCCHDKQLEVKCRHCNPVVGLLAEHVPASAVDGPASALHAVQRRGDAEDQTGGLYVGEDLDAGCFLPQREASRLPRGHHAQQTYFPARQRQSLVCLKVSSPHLVFKKI